jgi:MFS family permease
MPRTNDAVASEVRESAEWRAGGRTVFFGALAYGSGPLLFLTTASVFIRPTMEATGWSTSQVLLSPLVIVLFTFLGPLVGRLVDRRGVRRAILIGLVPYILMLILFATLPANRFTFYLLATGVGIFGAFGYLVPYSRAVAYWFDKGAGKAFGIVGVGGAAMPLLGVPLVTLAIYQAGWQAGYLVLAAFTLLIALPGAFFGIQERHDRGRGIETGETADTPTADSPDEPKGEGVRQILVAPRFWIFSMHIFFVGGAASGFLSNMQPMLLDGGLDVAVATTVTTLFTAGIIFGRFGAGVFMDLVDRYRVAISVFLVSMLGALALANIELLPVTIVAVAALLTAVGQGAEGDIGAYFILKEYGRDHFGTLYAAAGIFGGAGGVVIPYAFSFIRDATGGYEAAAYLGAALYVAGTLAIILFGLLGRIDPRGAGMSPEVAETGD